MLQIIITIAVIVIYAEAGVITSASNPKLDSLLTESSKNVDKIDKLLRHPKKYTEHSLSLKEYNKTHDKASKLTTSSKSWSKKDIPQIIKHEDESKKYSHATNNDVIQFEVKNVNNNVTLTVDEKSNNQQMSNNDSAVEYLELDLYPNILDEDVEFSTETVSDSNHVANIDDRIRKLIFGDDTVLVSDVKGKHIVDDRENSTEDEGKVIVSQSKTESIADKQNIDINMTIPIECNDTSVIYEEEKQDFDEFIFLNNEENFSEFATENSFDYFEIAADLFIDEPRFKR